MSAGRLVFVGVMLIAALWIVVTGIISGSENEMLREYEWTGRLFVAGLCVIFAVLAILSNGSKSDQQETTTNAVQLPPPPAPKSESDEVVGAIDWRLFAKVVVLGGIGSFVVLRFFA